MSLQNIVSGDYGQIIELTFIDVDTNAAADISGYSGSIEMIFKPRDGEETTKSASFKTDGTDGVIQYTLENGLLAEGYWKVRGRVQTGDPATAILTTEWHEFLVLD